MRLNTLKPADGARKERVRVGRGIGSGLGKTAVAATRVSSRAPARARSRPASKAARCRCSVACPRSASAPRSPRTTPPRCCCTSWRCSRATPSTSPRCAPPSWCRARAKRAKIVKKGELDRKFVLKGVRRPPVPRPRSKRPAGRGVIRGAVETQWVAPIGGLGKFTELRQRLLFVLGALIVYRHRLLHPGAGRQSRGDGPADAAAGHDRGHVQHVLGRRAGALQPVRAERDAVHLRLDHHPALRADLPEPARRCRRKASPAGARSPSTRASARSCWRSSRPRHRHGAAGQAPVRHVVVYSPGPGFVLTAVVSLTAGTMFLMWLGEQVTERGVGNGISLIIFAGIVAGLPGAVIGTWSRPATATSSADGDRDHRIVLSRSPASWCSSSAASAGSRSTTRGARAAGRRT
jgi:hypothetical protein